MYVSTSHDRTQKVKVSRPKDEVQSSLGTVQRKAKDGKIATTKNPMKKSMDVTERLRMEDEQMREKMYKEMIKIKKHIDKRVRAAEVICIAFENCVMRRKRDGMKRWIEANEKYKRIRKRKIEVLQMIQSRTIKMKKKVGFNSLKQNMKYCRKLELQRIHDAALKIQMVWRRKKAYINFQNTVREALAMKRACLVSIYACYRAKKIGMTAALFREKCDSDWKEHIIEKERQAIAEKKRLAELERQRKIALKIALENRETCARMIQKCYRNHVVWKHRELLYNSATRIQSWLRCLWVFRPYKEIYASRKQAALVLQRAYRVHDAKGQLLSLRQFVVLNRIFAILEKGVMLLNKLRMDIMATRLAYAWRAFVEARRQRLLKHMNSVLKVQATFRMFLAQKELRKLRTLHQILLNEKARVIQRMVRRTLLRMRRNAASLTIQLCVRGFLARKVLAMKKELLRVAMALAAMSALDDEAVDLRYHYCAISIQRMARCRRARGLYEIFRVHRKKEHAAATKIQAVWRSKASRLHMVVYKHEMERALVMRTYTQFLDLKKMKDTWEQDVEKYEQEQLQSREKKEEDRAELRGVEIFEKNERQKHESILRSWMYVKDDPTNPQSSSGYYYNSVTGVCQLEEPEGFVDVPLELGRRQFWHHPPNPEQMDLQYAAWQRVVNESGTGYFYKNTITEETSETRPFRFRDPEIPSQMPVDIRAAEMGNDILCCLCMTTEADRRCCECGPLLPYCLACFFKSHDIPGFREHECEIIEDILFSKAPLGYTDPPPEEEVMEEDGMCAECFIEIATLYCEFCGDPMCEKCFNRLHASGERKKHTWVKFQGFTWDEYYDEATGRSRYFNVATNEFTFETPVERMYGPERKKYLEIEAQKQKHLAECKKLEELKAEIEEIKNKRKKAQIAEQQRQEYAAKFEQVHARVSQKTEFVGPSIQEAKKEEDEIDIDALLNKAMSEDEDNEVVGKPRQRRRKGKKYSSNAKNPEYLEKLLG